MSFRLKRLLIGRPLSNKVFHHQRLDNFSALAIFASDALSSVAYATEEILLVLALAQLPNFSPLFPISICIAILLLIVTFSYRQTIHAYPSGGGAYTVAKDNLGQNAGLVAGAALLIDYVLTVSVSIAAGVSAITSAFPSLYPYKIVLALVAVTLVAIGNLRGTKESGLLFAPPTYAFMFLMFALIGKGLFDVFTGRDADEVLHVMEPFSMESVSWILVLRAFSSGCTALTGIEAISNGVMAFRKPEAKNASKVLLWLGAILCVMFLGISYLAWHLGAIPMEKETVLSQLARALFGEGVLYYVVQGATCAILILAANTSFNDFPRLCSLMARDRFLPRQLQNLGDRLVFSNAILLLSLFSSLLLILYHANTHSLIPLYAVGVFLSFSLSQFGMVRHHLRDKGRHWRGHLAINLVGAVLTTLVLLVIIAMKFTHGAWIICFAIPVLVKWFRSISQHYDSVQRDLQIEETFRFKHINHKVIVPVSNIHKGVIESLVYARSLSSDVQAITIVVDEEQAAKFREKWESLVPEVQLVVIQNSYRSLLVPLVNHIKQLMKAEPDDLITVVIPSFVPVKWWHNLLHNQSSTLLKLALRTMKNVIVTSVHVHLTR